MPFERAPVSLAIALTCLLLTTAGEPLTARLAWERSAILHGELWRLWSGHLVHYSPSHGAADALAFFAMGRLAEPLVGSRRFASVLLGGAALISVGLLACAPSMIEYRGASGLAMLAAALAGALLWRRQPEARWLIGAATLALAAKMLADASGHAPTLAGLPVGVAVSWQAHLIGALLGTLLGTLLGAAAAGQGGPQVPKGPQEPQVPRLPRAASSALRAAFSAAMRAFSSISMR